MMLPMECAFCKFIILHISIHVYFIIYQHGQPLINMKTVTRINQNKHSRFHTNSLFQLFHIRFSSNTKKCFHIFLTSFHSLYIENIDIYCRDSIFLIRAVILFQNLSCQLVYVKVCVPIYSMLSTLYNQLFVVHIRIYIYIFFFPRQ